MKKASILKNLKSMEKVFAQDAQAMAAIDLLKQRSNLLPEDVPAVEKAAPNFDVSQIIKQPNELAAFTDGGCRGNPGPGAWAYMIQNARSEIVSQASGYESPTTNNRMELSGVIQAIKASIHLFHEQAIAANNARLLLYTDSKYVVDGMNSWVAGWKARGWRKADNKEPENLDLWQELDALRDELARVEFNWVKGHAGHPQNEYCDQMANDELDQHA
jgi:ribonuclease HI